MFDQRIGGVGQRLSVGGVARGGLFLFVGMAVTAVIGYVYWLLVSLLTGSEVVGTANSILSLSLLFSGIAILGVPTGAQRFLGREFGRNNVKSLNTYFWTSFIFTLALCLFSAVVIWLIAFLGIPLAGFSGSMLLFSGIIAFLNFSAIMSALFASIVRTEYIAISNVVSNIAKLGLGIFLIYLGFGWPGAVMGVIASSFALVALMLFFASRELKRLGGINMSLSGKALRESLHAGLVSWLPAVVALVGQQLSILIVFQFQGGSEAGRYFIAYAMFSLVYTLPASFMSVLFPVLSGSTGERKKLAWRVLKVCLALACPSAIFLMVYAQFPLSLMGADYLQAAPTLSLLSLSMIPLIFVSAVSNLVYASGSYGKALGIGLAVNIPQVILYFLLVPVYGAYGVALSFLTGAIVGSVAAACIARIVKFQVSTGKIAIAIMTPLPAAVFCLALGLDWLIGGVIVLVMSIICYGRLGIVERSDLAEIAHALASEKTVAKASKRFNWLLRIMYGGQ